MALKVKLKFGSGIEVKDQTRAIVILYNGKNVEEVKTAKDHICRAIDELTTEKAEIISLDSKEIASSMLFFNNFKECQKEDEATEIRRAIDVVCNRLSETGTFKERHPNARLICIARAINETPTSSPFFTAVIKLRNLGYDNVKLRVGDYAEKSGYTDTVADLTGSLAITLKNM